MAEKGYLLRLIGEQLAKLHVEKGQCVYFTWLDSSTVGNGWVYDELKAHPKEIESVGFVCDLTPSAVMIAGTRSASGGVVTPLTIPIGAIQVYKIIEL